MTRRFVRCVAVAALFVSAPAGATVSDDESMVEASHALSFAPSEAGDEVVIVLRGARAVADAAITSVSDRIELELTPGLPAETLQVQDETIQRIELFEGVRPRLSLKIRHGRIETMRLAVAARVRISGSEIRVTIPRDSRPTLLAMGIDPESIGVEAPRVAAPAPPAVARPLAQVEAVVERAPAAATVAGRASEPVPASELIELPRSGVTAPAVAAAAAAAPAVAVPAPAIATGSGVATEGVPETLIPPTLAVGGNTGQELQLARGPSFGPVPFAAAVLLLGGSAALFMFARRRRGVVPLPLLHIRASQALGGRSRLVLLSAGERELLLAVDPRGVKLVARWRGDGHGVEKDRGAQLDDAAGDDADAADAELAGPRRAPAGRKSSSSAISGLLKLREQQDDDSPPDAEWVRELLAAAKTRRAR